MGIAPIRKGGVMKYLVVEMSDSKRWAIPSMLIAKDRAAYYAKLDSERGDGEYDTIYEDELEYALSDDYELTDWAHNSMNWADVSAQAVELLPVNANADYGKDWVNAPMAIKDMEL
jgi:hypothetical protein